MTLENFSLLQNILLGLTLAAPIGPVNLEIIKRGLNSGFKQAFLTGIGAMSADATYLTLIFFGLTSFLNIAFMKIVMGIGGSIILIYLGFISVKEYFHKSAAAKNHGYEPQGKPWTLIPPKRAEDYTLRLWRDCSTNKCQYTSFLKFESHNKPARMFESSFVTGYVLAISSPMTIVWWTGVFGALLASQTDTQTNLSAFLSCLSILLGCFAWVFFLAAALHRGKKIINEKITAFISLIAGIFLIVFGIYFLYKASGLIIDQL